MKSHHTVRSIAAALAFALVGSCGDAPTAPSPAASERSAESASLFGVLGPRPLVCPSTETQATTDILGISGGTLSIGGASVLIPAGALLGPTKIRLTVPASTYMEIDVSVEGVEHFIFELPITVTVSYARCNSIWSRVLPLTAWHWDSETRKFLERMPSVDNKLTRTVTFTTPHLSGYIIAN